jgi:hypothetical protein
MQGIHAKIDKAVRKLNAIRGKPYPDIGAFYYADVRGEGNFKPKIYVCINANGGLSEYCGLLNRSTYAATLRGIELEISLIQAVQ